MAEKITPSISRGERDYEEKTEKFPEEETADGGRFGDYDVYDKVEVDDWFKRCIAEYPRGAYKDIDYEKIDWFNKWFSQFKKDEADADEC